MKTETILKKLKEYLNGVACERLRMVFAVSPDIVFCLTVADVVREHSDTPEREKEICILLQKLCKNYFKKA